MKYRLSKSKFMRGLQCAKSLWLYTFKPELRSKPGPALMHIFEEGHAVGKLAQQLFPGGALIKFNYRNFAGMINKTRELIDTGVDCIYEATFSAESNSAEPNSSESNSSKSKESSGAVSTLIMADILHRRKNKNGENSENAWNLYEVKSTTSVKNEHVFDLAIQYYVLKKSGMNINKTCLVHLNNNYERAGAVDINALFTIADMTEEVLSAQEFITREIEKQQQVLSGACPEVPIGTQCDLPYECDFKPFCWQDVPKVSVFDLKGRTAGLREKKFALYHNGVKRLADIEENDVEPGLGLGLDLDTRQRMQITAEKTGKVFVDKETIQGFLDTLYYPLYFLDFETFHSAIPPFDGTRPYGHVPFQYSLHSIEKEGGELRHSEFLAKAGTDERRDIARRLCKDIPDDACVLAYYMSFEKMILRGLAREFPEFEDGLIKISENMKDLIIPFKERYYYTREMQGSASLKKVLPAMCPELGYIDMGVSNGEEASLAYVSLGLRSEKEREQIREDLLEYCRLDTYGLVKILERLKIEVN